MASGRNYQDNAISWNHASVTMDDEARGEAPPPIRFLLNGSQHALSHPRVMLKGHRPKRRTVGIIPDYSDEACHPPDCSVPVQELVDLGTRIKVNTLHPNHRLSLRS